jgi:hypothetical protein
MPINGNDLQVLHAYAEDLLNADAAHADHIKGIILALLGGIIWRADAGTLKLKPHTGTLANLLWLAIGGKTYIFAYNHALCEIELRDRTQGGSVLHSFSNATPISYVHAVFRGL